MNSHKEKFDIIIVGAGISAILTALALSKEGKNVLIIEKSSYIGGNCRTYEIDGFNVDTGPHAITDLQNGPLKILIKKYFSVVPRFLPFGGYFVRYQNKLQEFPLTLIQLARFDILSKRDRILLSGALIDAVANSSLNKRILDQSVFEFIKKYNPSSKSVKFLDAVCYFLSGKSIYKTPTWRVLGGSGYVDEDDNSAASHFRKFIKIAMQDYSTQGYPIGGIQNITSCAINSFPKNKVTIRTNEEVLELITKDNRVIGIKSDKRLYDSDTVVYSGFVKDLPKLTRSLPKKYVAELNKIEQAKSFTIWLGLKKKLPSISYIGSEIYFDSDSPYWAMPTSNLDASLAPKNIQLIGFTTIFDKECYEKQLHALKACIFKAIPDIKENIIFEHIQTAIPEKAAVTTKVRFPSPKSPIDGLYLVGTDTDMRSMGVTRASFSVLKALQFMKEDGIY